MKTKEAVLKVLKDTGKSKYWLAMQIEVRPIMISNYIRPVAPCKMSKPTASRFTALFDIVIDDIYNPMKEINDDTVVVPGGE